MTVWVKTCGLARESDIEAAVIAGTDAIGLVIHEPSPRHVDPVLGRGLATAVRDMGPEVSVVLVTRHQDPFQVLGWAEEVGADTVQPHGRHGREAADVADRAGFGVILPVAESAQLPAGWVPMLDGPDPGSGVSLDWDSLATADLGERWILAGGLTPDNVEEAISLTRPWGVDASSGLESAPGIKDPERIRAFVRAAKGAGDRS